LKIEKIEDFENPDREIGKEGRNRENPAGIGKVGRYGMVKQLNISGCQKGNHKIPFYPKEHEQINRLKDRQAF
jgi:hypothetical protein